MKGSKKRGAGETIFHNGSCTLSHPWTRHVFASMSYSWVIHSLWVIPSIWVIILCRLVFFRSSMTSRLGINSLYLWSSFIQCFQVKSFVMPICSRDVSRVNHMQSCLPSKSTISMSIVLSLSYFFTPSICVSFMSMMGDTSIPYFYRYLSIDANTLFGK